MNQNQTPSKIIYIIVISEAILAAIGMMSLCATMFWKNYSDPAVLTAIITLTGGLVGSLGTILANTRIAPKNGPIDTTTQSTITTTTKPSPPAPPVVSDTPAPVIVKNPDPIPVTEAPKP